MLDGANQQEKIIDDWVVAFLRAGIFVNKLDHASSCGVIWGYTKVATPTFLLQCHFLPQISGSIHKGTTLSRSSDRVGQVHLDAVCQKLSGQKVWVATDEWTDSQGHAIMNVLLGCNGNVYVGGSIQLDCKGPNLGVEHSELASSIVSTLTDLGVQLKDVYAFVSGMPVFFFNNALPIYLPRFCCCVEKGIQRAPPHNVSQCTMGPLHEPRPEQHCKMCVDWTT